MFYESYKLVRIFVFAKMKFVIHEVHVNIKTSETSSVLNITGILMVYCYVSIVIAIQLFVWSVVSWISNTLYTSKSFVFVFSCHIHLTSGSLYFSLYIGTAHYRILQFLVFFSFCLHDLLALYAPGCYITNFRWTQFST